MRPETRRLLALGAALAALVAGAALWTATRPSASSGGPAGTPAGAENLALVNGTPSFLPVVVKPAPTPTPGPVLPPASGDWRAYLAYYRALARLPALAENGDWSAGAAGHACYMVENQELATDQEPGKACFGSQGDAAAPNSLLLMKGDVNFSDRQALDQWMQWPFHALAVLDPRLAAAGFGTYRDQSPPFGSFRMGAALDTRRGLGDLPPAASFPIRWPDHNSAVYLTSYDGQEQPDPLTSCPGFPFGGPAGLPIIVQFGPGSVTPSVTAHSFRRGATDLAHCVFTETSYVNSIANLQAAGRELLNRRDAVVLIPREPLAAGSAYTVSLTVNGATMTWTFRVVSPP
jgi:hypothetical protein